MEGLYAMKHGLHTDGRKCGPVNPSNINEEGWTWYNTSEERDDAIPIDWHAHISQRADTELQRGVTVTIGGTTYGIRTGPQALALIDGAAIRADVAARNNQSVSRRVPTDQGTVSFDGPALWQIFEAVESHQQSVAERAEALEAMVADGSITEGELEKGWT